jgi:outer membrane protein OmpA-like peptidoglycan-associated protein
MGDRKVFRSAASGAALVAMLTGCAALDNSAEPGRTGAGAAAGAVVGGIVGGVVASPGLRAQGAAIGAAVGAALGGVAGFAIDRQRRELESRFAAERERNEVEIRQLREDVVLLTLSGGLQFATNSAAVKPGLRDSLVKVADVMRSNPGMHVGIIGHTDNVGGDAFNQDLSERRAYAVRNELLALGVPADAMFPIGRGATEPRADNATESGRTANRRVELVLTRPEAA